LKATLGFVPSPLLYGRELYRLPALHLALLLSAGIIANVYGVLTPGLIIALAVAGLSILLIRRFLSPQASRMTALALWGLGVFLLGGAVFFFDSTRRSDPPPLLEKLYDSRPALTGRVVDVDGDRAGKGSLILDAWGLLPDREDRVRLGLVRVSWYDSVAAVLPGDSIRVVSRLRRPGKPRNPGDFDYYEYLARRNIFSYVSLGTRDTLRMEGTVAGG
jgi:competence protein ComEC